MAVCTTGAEWGSESAYVAGRLLQIFQAILRTLRDSHKGRPLAMRKAAMADSVSREVKSEQQRTTQDAVFERRSQDYAED